MDVIEIEAGVGAMGSFGPVEAGPTTMRIQTSEGADGAWVGLARLSAGVGLEQFVDTLQRAYARDGSAAEAGRRVDVEAQLLGGAAVTSSTAVTFTQTLSPGRIHLIDYKRIMSPDAMAGIGTLEVVPGEARESAQAEPAVVLHRTAEGPRIDAPATISAGSAVVIRNDTGQFNEAVWMQVRDDATGEDVDRFFAAVTEGRQPPVPDLVRSQPTGCVPLGPGVSAAVALDVPAGRYVLTTWITDYATGVLFARQGMHRLVTVEGLTGAPAPNWKAGESC